MAPSKSKSKSATRRLKSPSRSRSTSAPRPKSAKISSVKAKTKSSQVPIVQSHDGGPHRSKSPTLDDFMSSPYALSFSPSFFGFYSYTGMISAVSPTPLATSGASAGAMAASAVAAGGTFSSMFSLKLTDIADFFPPPMMLRLGLFRGEKFEQLLQSGYERTTIESCQIPLAISVYDLRTLSVSILTTGTIAKAARASSTFPGLFAPVYYDEWCTADSDKSPGYLIDGGIKDVWGGKERGRGANDEN
ncbi:hypothetical protein TrLO_g7051 [Triparma laevis f. longispina]|uniref:PNPLA domain-containing protein n=1 Tax=Triparma laevis f. longispina TaxID=1714387 RepID=A0A9W7L014_9STRA|nr:hypothetical protein TrLO_g7051 [Triparma laevis f. longispina]